MEPGRLRRRRCASEISRESGPQGHPLGLPVLQEKRSSAPTVTGCMLRHGLDPITPSLGTEPLVVLSIGLERAAEKLTEGNRLTVTPPRSIVGTAGPPPTVAACDPGGDRSCTNGSPAGKPCGDGPPEQQPSLARLPVGVRDRKAAGKKSGTLPWTAGFAVVHPRELPRRAMWRVFVDKRRTRSRPGGVFLLVRRASRNYAGDRARRRDRRDGAPLLPCGRCGCGAVGDALIRPAATFSRREKGMGVTDSVSRSPSPVPVSASTRDPYSKRPSPLLPPGEGGRRPDEGTDEGAGRSPDVRLQPPSAKATTKSLDVNSPSQFPSPCSQWEFPGTPSSYCPA